MPWPAYSCAACFVSPSTPCFAAVYCGWPGAGDHTGRRRDVDDRAAAALREELAELVLHAEEHAGEVDVDRALPLGERVVDERLGVGRDAGVVHRAVEAAEAVDRGLHHRRDRAVVGDVGRDRDRVALDGARRADRRGLVDVGDDDARALLRRTAARSRARCRCPRR